VANKDKLAKLKDLPRNKGLELAISAVTVRWEDEYAMAEKVEK
jgi:hypothetical protein